MTAPTYTAPRAHDEAARSRMIVEYVSKHGSTPDPDPDWDGYRAHWSLADMRAVVARVLELERLGDRMAAWAEEQDSLAINVERSGVRAWRAARGAT